MCRNARQIGDGNGERCEAERVILAEKPHIRIEMRWKCNYVSHRGARNEGRFLLVRAEPGPHIQVHVSPRGAGDRNQW